MDAELRDAVLLVAKELHSLGRFLDAVKRYEDVKERYYSKRTPQVAKEHSKVQDEVELKLSWVGGDFMWLYELAIQPKEEVPNA